MEQIKIFGKVVKDKRIALDWSQERLGLEIHRCIRTIRTIESGSKPVCPRTIAQIKRIWPEIFKNEIVLDL